MRGLGAFAVFLLIGLLCYAPARAEDVAPVAPAPASDTTGELHWFRCGYGHIGGLLSLGGWGSFSSNGVIGSYDLTSRIAGGIHLSGYWVAHPSFNLGAYFDYFKGKGVIENAFETNVENFGVGISIKAGGLIGVRVWLGLVCDIGVYALSIDTLKDTYYGLEISPRFHLDVLSANVRGLKIGFFAAVGPSFIPYIKASINGNDFKVLGMTVQMRFGFTFGA